MARPVAEAMQDALASLAPVHVDGAERVRPTDPMTAIKTYWRPLLPQWLAAIFVDFAPAILLIILIAARREADRAAKHGTDEGAFS